DPVVPLVQMNRRRHAREAREKRRIEPVVRDLVGDGDNEVLAGGKGVEAEMAVEAGTRDPETGVLVGPGRVIGGESRRWKDDHISARVRAVRSEGAALDDGRSVAESDYDVLEV